MTINNRIVRYISQAEPNLSFVRISSSNDGTAINGYKTRDLFSSDKEVINAELLSGFGSNTQTSYSQLKELQRASLLANSTYSNSNADSTDSNSNVNSTYRLLTYSK